MRYAQIREMDISNGEGVGISLFVQGCHFHCKDCFNQETWDFNGGNDWTQEIKDNFIELAKQPYIKRISILGGEPLANENTKDVLDLVCTIKNLLPDKQIWLYTGYTWDDITMKHGEIVHNHNYQRFDRHCIVSQCDVLVDGQFETDKKDLTLKFRGSSNQRLIDVQKSLESGELILWEH